MGIVIDAEPAETLDVKLVGVDYKITPPKTSLLMQVTDKMQGKEEEDVTSEDLYRFVDLMFTKTDSVKVKKRLNDPKDALDIDHVMSLLDKLMEAVQPNPTTS